MAGNDQAVCTQAANQEVSNQSPQAQQKIQRNAWPVRNRRGLLKWIAGVCAWPLLAACDRDVNKREGERMGADKKNLRYFDVVMLSYYERSIFDVLLNGVDIGAAGPPPHKGSGGVIVGVPVTLGSQLVTWRLDGPEGTPRNGETVTAKNQPVLEDVDPDLRYLGVHIYPDDTVEIIPEMYWPSNSPKGEVFLREWEAKHGRQ